MLNSFIDQYRKQVYTYTLQLINLSLRLKGLGLNERFCLKFFLKYLTSYKNMLALLFYAQTMSFHIPQYL